MEIVNLLQFCTNAVVNQARLDKEMRYLKSAALGFDNAAEI
jgi:hypothetical protein